MRRAFITAAILVSIVGGSAFADEAPKEQLSNHTTTQMSGCQGTKVSSLSLGGHGSATGHQDWNGGAGDALNIGSQSSGAGAGKIHAVSIGSATGGAGAGKARFGSGGGSGRTDPNGRTDPAGQTNEMAMVSHGNGSTDCASGKH
jgi:hypothetical protein